MNNFIYKIFGHKYIQVIEIRVIEFLWKEDEVTYMLNDWYFETEEDAKDEEYTSNMYYEITLKASLNNKLPNPV